MLEVEIDKHNATISSIKDYIKNVKKCKEILKSFKFDYNDGLISTQDIGNFDTFIKMAENQWSNV